MKVSVIVVGEYSHPINESLWQAIRESIEQHLTAYGLTAVSVAFAHGETKAAPQ